MAKWHLYGKKYLNCDSKHNNHYLTLKKCSDIILFFNLTIFRELLSRKNALFPEQMMSADNIQTY